VLAASSIRAVGSREQQLDSVLLYLGKHGQHVSSIEVENNVNAHLQQLPHEQLQGLSSLTISWLVLQLQPARGFQGVLGAAMLFQRLVINKCRLLDWSWGVLGAALATVPSLQHLSIKLYSCEYVFSIEALKELQQLTYLELVNFGMSSRGGIRHLQGLTRLQDLRLQCCSAINIDSSELSSVKHLTRFELCEEIQAPEEAGMCTAFDPGFLADRTVLQHLRVEACSIARGAAGVTELMSHLQQLQQLTYLNLECSLEATAPAAAYSV
jgi:hypothetical protein